MVQYNIRYKVTATAASCNKWRCRKVFRRWRKTAPNRTPACYYYYTPHVLLYTDFFSLPRSIRYLPFYIYKYVVSLLNGQVDFIFTKRWRENIRTLRRWLLNRALVFLRRRKKYGKIYLIFFMRKVLKCNIICKL